MKISVPLVCLIILLSGCIVIGQDPVPTSTNTEGPTTAIYEQSAKTPAQPKTPGSSSLNASKIEYTVHEKINEIRSENGLHKLEYDERLAAIGRYHSWDMAQKGYFSHNSTTGLKFDERFTLYDYNCPYAAENIALFPGPTHLYENNSIPLEITLAEELVEGWMNSPGHRKNILNPNYKAEGIGIFITEKGTMYASQEFCG